MLTPEQIERGRASVAAGPQGPGRSQLHDIPVEALHQRARDCLDEVVATLKPDDIWMKRLLARFIEDAEELLDEVRLTHPIVDRP